MSENPRAFWKKALQPGADCLTPDHFAVGLTPAQETHVQSCPRCQAEQAMWNSFSEAPSGEEAGAVRWVAAEVERRIKQPRESARRWNMDWMRTWSAGLAAAALVLMIGVYTWRPGSPPAINGPGANDVYRSGAIETVAPKGDVTAAPLELRWTAVPAAASYEVSISEVDGTVMWTGETAAAQIAVPEPVRARLVAGKTVSWKVNARSAGGAPIAVSGEEAFRVKP